MTAQRSSPAMQGHSAARRSARLPWYRQLGVAVASDRARFIAFTLFLLIIAFTGGSSRPDTLSLILLRPAAVLFACYAFIAITHEQAKEVRAPLLIVAALMLLSLLQLFPLPASIWMELPRREVAAEASTLLGIGDLSRPLSLDPDRTWNTFFSLFVPLAAIGLAVIQSEGRRRLVIPALMGVGVLSAGMGFLQAVSGTGLHFYRVTHAEYPVGLFANKNHQSVMLLWLILAISWFLTTIKPKVGSNNSSIILFISSILVIFPLVVLTGSRAGLLLSLPVMALSGWMLFRSPAMMNVRKIGGRNLKIVSVFLILIIAIPVALFVLNFSNSGRVTAISRLFEKEATEDLRWQYLSIFKNMAHDLMPFGSGFGSFEKVFNLYEPSEMLTSRYMNQAHNELMQIAIEGGIPALLVLFAAIIWLVVAILKVWNSRSSGDRNFAILHAGSAGLWMSASLVDYPIRTPLAAAVVAVLTAHLAMLSTRHRSDPSLRSE